MGATAAVIFSGRHCTHCSPFTRTPSFSSADDPMTRRGALGLRGETATPMRQGVWCLLPVVLNAVPETHGNQRVVRPCDVQTHGCVCVCVHASVLASNPNVTLLPLQTEKTISDICTRETPTVPDSHMVRDTTPGSAIGRGGGFIIYI